MASADDQKKVAKLRPDRNSAAGVLVAQREKILDQWVKHVRGNVKAAKRERHPIIVDTIPAFLDNLVEALMPNYPRDVATESSTIAQEHGGERARVTRYKPEDVIYEYQLLRNTLLEVLESKVTLKKNERSVIIRSIDTAMTESLTAFFLVHSGIREQFTLTLTHDMRSPLTAVLANAQMILRYPDKHEQHAINAARIIENARRMDRMIQDLLDASRVRSGEKLNFTVATCDIHAIARDTIEQLEAIHGDRFDLKGKSLIGYWNADGLKRAFENLLINAVKYGDSETRITMTIEEVHGRALLRVHNFGAEIPAEDRETLFQAFRRAKATQDGKRKGWGLGLALVRGVAEGHGGSIGVDSSPDRGTTFTMDLPLDARPFQTASVTPD